MLIRDEDSPWLSLLVDPACPGPSNICSTAYSCRRSFLWSFFVSPRNLIKFNKGLIAFSVTSGNAKSEGETICMSVFNSLSSLIAASSITQSSIEHLHSNSNQSNPIFDELLYHSPGFRNHVSMVHMNLHLPKQNNWTRISIALVLMRVGSIRM